MKKILVGLDASYRAHAVFVAAIEAAKECGGQLVLVRAAHIPHDFPVEAYSMPPSQVTEILELRARTDLEKFARDLPPEMKGGLVVSTDEPWRAICRTAISENADLIFIGTHDFESSGCALGATASMVVTHADRPVLLFRQPPTPKPIRQPEKHPQEARCEPF